MAGMGPAPKDPSTRARRNTTLPMTHLPSEGRKGRTPPWPLAPDIALAVRAKVARAKVGALLDQIEECTDVQRPALERRLEKAETDALIAEERRDALPNLERAVWSAIWKTPQAQMWERLRWTRDVAAYCRHKALGELGDLDAAKESRQWSDRLGLNSLALRRLGWEIPAAEVDVKPASGPGPQQQRGGRYRDLRVVGD